MTVIEAAAALAIILAACLTASVWVNVAYSQMVSDLVKQRTEAAAAETDAYLAVQDAYTDAEKVREELAHVKAQRDLNAILVEHVLVEGERLERELALSRRSNVVQLHRAAGESPWGGA